MIRAGSHHSAFKSHPILELGGRILESQFQEIVKNVSTETHALVIYFFAGGHCQSPPSGIKYGSL